MPTIADVAERAGVGVGTVSRVLNDSPLVSDRTRARVLAVIEEMNYRPSYLARGLSIGTAGVLAAVVQRMTSPSALQRLRGILDVASEAGFDVILHNVNSIDDYRDQVRDLLRPDRCAGGLLVSIRPDDEDISALADNPVPVVIVDGQAAGLSSLFIDDELGGRMATEHLIELGHQRIAFVGDWEDHVGFRPMGKRRTGYRKAMADAGLEVPDDYIKTGPHEHLVTLAAINELLDLDNPPTAVVASADSHAMVISEGARARGVRVPEDLSVIGFDDLELAEHLGLSTIRQPLYESGARGARMLLDLMDAEVRTAQHVELPVELIARGSTAAPGKNG
ncbi:MAG: LacI family DNA-binding transcriptional regulator [Acidimicrobiia bacterium]|nr:LacI family DNA-binding transcriptional regulator [Acidimicrobiia bacterium]